MNFGHLVRFIIYGVFISFASVAIYIALKPFYVWYLSKIPILGVDFFYSATYVSYHLKHFSPYFNSFKDIWFGGSPFFFDFPQLHFYLMVPFAKYLGLIGGIQIYILTSLTMFGIFSSLLFLKLSKNIGLSIFLAISVLLSSSIYGAAIWGGSLPYFSTQAFLPIVILLLVQYLSSGNRRWFWVAVLASGISISGHPMPVVTFIFPAVVTLILLWRGNEFRYKLTQRLKDLVLLFFFVILISFQIFNRPLVNMLSSIILGGNLLAPLSLVQSVPVNGSLEGTSQLSVDISNFYKNQIDQIKSGTNGNLFFAAIGGFVVFCFAFVISKQRFKRLGRVLPFVVYLCFVFAHIYLNLTGRGFLSQGLYRAFWVFPFALGLVAAVFWGEFFDSLEKLFLGIKIKFNGAIFFVLTLGVSFVFILFGANLYKKNIDSLLRTLDEKSEYSSAFPEALSIKTKPEEQEALKKSLVPSFLDPNDKNKRLYEAEAGVNIWWNAYFDIPLARGYIDPPIATSERGGIFWLDIAIANDSLVRDFGINEDIAYKNALFLIDWNAIYFFEGGRLSSKGSNVGPSSYLVKNKVFDKVEEATTSGAIIKFETQSGKPELRLDLPQILKYYRVSGQHTSPVLYQTNAPAVIFFGDLPSYEDFLRVIASENINSKKLIPVNGGKYLDKFSAKDFSNFSAVFLSNYDYKDKGKVFKNLAKYAEQGGKVFIDTGSEVKESDSDNLPDIFPMEKSRREGLGEKWRIATNTNSLLDGIDTNKFGPLIFNEQPWKLTYAQAGLREGSTIVLKHEGKPVLIQRKLGRGQVVWSGINLTYHFNQYKVDDEAKLLTNILKEFIKIEDQNVLESKITWVKPEEVIIEASSKSKGILFKQQGYAGWKAKLVSENNKKLPIYLAGPTYPGFMYVPLGKAEKENATVKFEFKGALTSKLAALVSFLAIVFILERIIFSGLFFEKKIFILKNVSLKKLMFWWDKEDA